MSPIRARFAQACRPRRVDAVEQRARFRRIEHRRLPGRDDMARPAHRSGRIDRHDLAGDEPVEQMTDRGEPLLDARGGQLARRQLDPRRDMHRLNGGDRWHADARAPAEEFIGRAGIGAARVRVCGCWRRRIRGSACRRARLAAATSAGTAAPFQATVTVAVIGIGKFVIAGTLRVNGNATTPRP
jgi:hypothetical protein